MIQIKRIYDTPAANDGFRILVDRLWPRGMSKKQIAIDKWLKDVAPSSELRVWFNHDPAKFAEFTKRYTRELMHNPAIKELAESIEEHDTVTLLFAAKDTNSNHAVVLKRFLQDKG